MFVVRSALFHFCGLPDSDSYITNNLLMILQFFYSIFCHFYHTTHVLCRNAHPSSLGWIITTERKINHITMMLTIFLPFIFRSLHCICNFRIINMIIFNFLIYGVTVN